MEIPGQNFGHSGKCSIGNFQYGRLFGCTFHSKGRNDKEISRKSFQKIHKWLNYEK